MQSAAFFNFAENLKHFIGKYKDIRDTVNRHFKKEKTMYFSNLKWKIKYVILLKFGSDVAKSYICC